jgi:hypothetical protein
MHFPVALRGTDVGGRCAGPSEGIRICLYIAIAVQNSPVNQPTNLLSRSIGGFFHLG